MSDVNQVEQGGPAKALLTMRIIWGALLQGVVVFAVIAIALIRNGEVLGADPFTLSDPLVLVGIVLGMACLVASYIMPPVVASSALKQVRKAEAGAKKVPGWEEWPAGSPRYFMVFQTAFIVRAAILEAPTFFNLIAYMQTGSGIALVLAGVLMLFLAMLFPTETAVRDWVERVSSDTGLT